MYVLGKVVHCKHCSKLIYELVRGTWVHQYSDLDSIFCRTSNTAEPEEELIDDDIMP